MRLARGVRSFVLLAIGTLLAGEIALQIASFFAPERSGAWRPGSTDRILCVGDSHTWGAGVDRDQSYPAQLQRFLDEAEPGVHSVMNLGVPGMNTAQLRKRVPEWLSRYEPDVLIVWAGVNNAWNSAEVDELRGPLLTWLDQRLLRSRLYRLVRVYLHDRGLERYAIHKGEEDIWQPEAAPGPIEGRQVFTVKHDGVVDQIEHERDANVPPVELRAVGDFRALAGYARTARTRVIFIAYPLNVRDFERANLALWRVAEQYDLPLVRSWDALARVPRKQQEWLWAMHPGAGIYGEIARDVARVVLDRDARYDADMTAEEFRRATREQMELGLRIAKQLALATAPLTQEERALLDELQRFWGTSFDVDDLPSITPSNLAAKLTSPNLRAGIIDTLTQLSRADGQSSPEEVAFVDAVRQALGMQDQAP